ncbi:MAG: PH domain-containing protein [Rikenellaceae bacterium]
MVWSVLHLLAVVAAGYAIYVRYDGSIFFAWFLSFVVALLLLLLLSIPRRVTLSDEHLTIYCVLDVTRIERESIVSVRRVPSSKIRWVVPLFAGCGFFGYYGLFLDLRTLNLFKMYGGEWRNLIEIIDATDDRYYISCRQGDQLVAQLSQAIAASK